VARINDLPMTEFVERTITKFLVETQMRRISERRRSA
jgi:hypothetical protein